MKVFKRIKEAKRSRVEWGNRGVEDMGRYAQYEIGSCINILH